MNIEQRLQVFVELGKILSEVTEESVATLQTAKHKNGWFIPDQSQLAFTNWSNALTAENVKHWAAMYPELNNTITPKKVGLIMAGNIPLVGLHDLISVLLTGHNAVVKLSSEDTTLMSYIISKIKRISPELGSRIEIAERLSDIEAVIATGSNNSSRYFEAYFGKYPNIIRKNRTSVAILEGNESSTDLRKLGQDIFTFYGLGCRNVTKLYVPIGYNFNLFYESIIDYASVLDNIKYVHNYDYHKTLFLLNSQQLLDNEFLLVKEDANLRSPIGVIHYEYTSVDKKELVKKLNKSEEIQCVVDNQQLKFGEAQNPQLWDYADDVDTLRFLLNL